MTSKFIQDILAEMENEINQSQIFHEEDEAPAEEEVIDEEEPSETDNEEIEESVDINAIKDLIQKTAVGVRHAMKQGNQGLADKWAVRLKDNLTKQGYNWKSDPDALEILGDYIEEAEDRKLSSAGRGEQAKKQLNNVWAQAINRAHGDLLLMSDADLGAAIKAGLNDESQNALMSILAKKTQGLELEPMVNQRDQGTFMNQRHIRDSKEYGDLDVMRESFIKELRVLLENEVEQAEVLMASKGFSEELQVMIEKLGRLMNEKLPPVIDQMRLAYGSEQADVFGETMRSDMQSILDTLLAVRENIDHAVLSISQGKMPHDDNDMDADGDLTDANMGDMGMDVEPSTDLQDELGGLADEFGGDVSMAGPEEDPLGREKKESFRNLKNQLTEMKKKIEQVKKSK